MENSYYKQLVHSVSHGDKCLAILIDPDKFDDGSSEVFLKKIPETTTHLFVGGSTVHNNATERTIKALKQHTRLPIFIFPGDFTQVTHEAHALLFLSLLSGRNPEYLIGQHIKAIPKLRDLSLEVIPTGYLLIDGGNESAVACVTNTLPLSQENSNHIVDTALAAQYMGMKLVYLEAGSGANNPVHPKIIKAVKDEISIPLIVGGGIRTERQKAAAFEAGADMIVMGTAFENQEESNV